jgi:hypothetical protein
VAAEQVSYNVADGSFIVTTTDTVEHDLSTVVVPPMTLAYQHTSDGPVVRVGLSTARFIVTLPSGQPLTFDPRTAKALDRLGWNIPRV